MKKLSNKFITETASQLVTLNDGAESFIELSRQLLQNAIQTELECTVPCTFDGFLAIANQAISLKFTEIQAAHNLEGLTAHVQAAKIDKAFKRLTKMLTSQAALHLNKASKLDGKRWALVQVVHTSKDKNANKPSWNGSLRLIQKPVKARIANPAGSSVTANSKQANAPTVSNPTADKFTGLSNAELIEIIIGKSKLQQQAFFKDVAASGKLKLSQDEIITALTDTVTAAKAIAA